MPGKDKGVVARRKIKQFETFMVDQAAVVVDMETEKALSRRENSMSISTKLASYTLLGKPVIGEPKH